MSNAATPLAIQVEGVDKTFRVPHEQVHTLKERALHPLRRPTYEQLEALQKVSFDVRQGEFFGIVGRNGSGKSTLLKCLAGIYRVDQGAISVAGRVSTFIELGVGFNMDLPARDNILINATMLGLTGREARARTDAVLEFAELENFVDLKLKNYSSGMLVRLAFSVMIQVDADVLLIDEVLAVGDAAFQQKCFDEFVRLRQERRTVVLVTHDMGSVERFCDRAMLIEHGSVVEIGEPRPVSMRYLQMNFADKDGERRGAAGDAAVPGEQAIAAGGDRPTNPGELRAGDGKAEIVGGWFANAAGDAVESLDAGERVTFLMHVRFSADVHDPVFHFTLRNAQDERVVVAHSDEQIEGEDFVAGDEVVVSFNFENVLAPDRYGVSGSVARRGSGDAWHDNRERFRSVIVTSTDPRGGLVDLPFQIGLHRQEAGALDNAGGATD